MKNHKISFLMAAHNEEKIIRKALNNLLNIPYGNYEVIIGLDGCTDKTEEIVKEFAGLSKKFRYFVLNLREGKTAVINQIIKESMGDIIIIHDADWIFRVKNKDDLDQLISIFDNEKVGGIAESFPLHFIPEIIDKKNIIELGVIWSSYSWMEYIRKKFTKRVYGNLILDKKKMSFPMLVNIFRKSLYKKNLTVGDDFERCIDILNSGFEVIIIESESHPRMISYGEKINLKLLLKQKERTALARKQIKRKYKKDYKLGFKFYIFLIKFMSKLRLKDNASLIIYILFFSIGTIKNNFSKEKSTKSAWQMRLER